MLSAGWTPRSGNVLEHKLDKGKSSIAQPRVAFPCMRLHPQPFKLKTNIFERSSRHKTLDDHRGKTS